MGAPAIHLLNHDRRGGSGDNLLDYMGLLQSLVARLRWQPVAGGIDSAAPSQNLTRTRSGTLETE